MGLLTDRINNKLEKSNLINEHALNREHVPLKWLIKLGFISARFQGKMTSLPCQVFVFIFGLVVLITNALDTTNQVRLFLLHLFPSFG